MALVSKTVQLNTWTQGLAASAVPENLLGMQHLSVCLRIIEQRSFKLRFPGDSYRHWRLRTTAPVTGPVVNLACRSRVDKIIFKKSMFPSPSVPAVASGQSFSIWEADVTLQLNSAH